MYLPAKFSETRPALLHGLMRAHPLGTVVTHGAGGLEANHIPFELDSVEGEHGVLRAHVARRNRLWEQDGANALVIFQGPSSYITPTLYDEKAASGKVVPTYHYAVVHAHGKLRTIDDPAWILALLGQQTARNEAGNSPPWNVSDAPAEYIDRLLKAIVGIEIRIERIEGKWKLGQDDTPADQARIEATMDAPMAALMRERGRASAA
jgi:transcriptional regulator